MQIQLKTLMTFELTDVNKVYLSRRYANVIDNNTVPDPTDRLLTRDDTSTDNELVYKGVAQAGDAPYPFDAILVYNSENALLAYAHLLDTMQLGSGFNFAIDEVTVFITVRKDELTTIVETRNYSNSYKIHSIPDRTNINPLHEKGHFNKALITKGDNDPIIKFNRDPNKLKGDTNQLSIEPLVDYSTTPDKTELLCNDDYVESFSYATDGTTQGRNFSLNLKFVMNVDRALYELGFIPEINNNSKEFVNYLVINKGKLFSDEIHGLYLSLVIDKDTYNKYHDMYPSIMQGFIFIGTNDYKFVEFYETYNNGINIDNDYVIFRNFNNIYIYSNGVTYAYAYNQTPSKIKYVTGLLMSGFNSIAKALTFYHIDRDNEGCHKYQNNLILPEFVDVTQIGYDVNEFNYINLNYEDTSDPNYIQDVDAFIKDVMNLNSPINFNEYNYHYNYIYDKNLRNDTRSLAILGMSYLEYLKNFAKSKIDEIRILSSFAVRLDKAKRRILVYPYNTYDEVLRQRKTIICDIANYRVESCLDYLYVIDMDTKKCYECNLTRTGARDQDEDIGSSYFKLVELPEGYIYLTYRGVKVKYSLSTCEVICYE